MGGGRPAAVDFWYRGGRGYRDGFAAASVSCAWRKILAAPWLAAVLYLLIPAVAGYHGSHGGRRPGGGRLPGRLAVSPASAAPRPLLAVLALLPLARETGICVTAGVVLAYVIERRYRLAIARRCHRGSGGAVVVVCGGPYGAFGRSERGILAFRCGRSSYGFFNRSRRPASNGG